jgi:DNA-binding MarR family transcriptional regulator
MSLPASHDDVPAKVAAALERIGQAFRVMAQHEARAHGLSPIQLLLLLRLAADPPQRRRPGALAREFDVSPASLSDSIAALERKGLVTRRRLGEDRRGFSLALSGSGRRLAERAQRVAGPLERAVAALPRGEQLALMGALFRVIAGLQEEGVVTVARMCVTCRHFRPDVRRGAQPHHCALLDVRLGAEGLRVDCPDHELAARSA